jgi:sec-independent protein translocase protein TatB
MMGIGFFEMVVIAGVALVLLGPEKFPDFAKIALRTIRDLRGYVDDVKQEITKEIRPIQNEIKTLSRYDPETYIDTLSSSSTNKGFTPPATDEPSEIPPADGAGSSSAVTQEGVGADPSALNLEAEGALPEEEDEESPEPPERLDG